MAEINDLFDQAATLCNEFASEITEAVESVTELRAGAEKVHQKATEGAEAVKKAFDGIEALMTSAEQEMEQARERADAGLEALVEKAAATGSEMKALVAAVKQGAADLEARKKELLDSIQAQRDAAAQDLEGRHQDLDKLATTARETFAQAEKALAGFREAAANAQGELETQMQEWQKAVDDLATGAARGADDWVEELEKLLKAAVGGMIKEGNEAVVKHNASMTAMKTAFVTTAPQKMDTSLRPLVDQLHAVVDAIDVCKAALPARAGEIAAKVSALVALIEQAGAAMDVADQL